ncbi:MAG: DUF3592 domain-containing protein [Acidobacteria bacterium]|nr:DUF3592 domain-containing protein [Acidobacteriota bacterium]
MVWWIGAGAAATFIVFAESSYLWPRANATLDQGYVVSGGTRNYGLQIFYSYEYRNRRYQGTTYRLGGEFFDNVSSARQALDRLESAPFPVAVCPWFPSQSCVISGMHWLGILLLTVFVTGLGDLGSVW